MKLVLGILLTFVMGAPPAWAALGEYEGSVDLDHQALGGEMRNETRAAYKLDQISTPDGGVISEYVSPEGRVFAISWRGPFIPNLEQLLGSYFPEVKKAARAHTGIGPLVIKTDSFVYFSGGRMKNFFGHASLPELFPKNLTAEVMP